MRRTWREDFLALKISMAENHKVSEITMEVINPVRIDTIKILNSIRVIEI